MSQDGSPLPTAGDVLRHYKAKHLDFLEIPASKAGQMKCFNLLIGHKIADVIATELTDSDVDAYVADRAAGLVGYEEDGKRRCYTKAIAGTSRGEIAQLKAALAYAVKNNRKAWPGLNASTVPELDVPAASPPRDHWLTKEQANTLLEGALQPFVNVNGPKAKATAPDGHLPPHYVFIALAMFTASRATAICELTWDRVHFTTDGGYVDYRKPGRKPTKKRRTQVQMAPALLAIMRRAARERTGPLVIHPGWNAESFRRHAKRVLGFEVGPHILRHSWATWAANDGVSMFDIAGVLADTVQTVERTYAKHAPDNLRRAVQLVGIGPAVEKAA